MWNKNNLQVFLSLTNLCNANCPQCNRTNESKLKAWDNLPLVDWSIDQFKKAFPKKVLKHIKLIKFCGTWGDPLMCKDLLKIVEYVIFNSKTHININTNGSLRNDDFWWELGCIGQKRLRVTFDIDGINQEMHSKYRVNTFLDKILDNMLVFTQTPAITYTQTIVFKHNQNYLKEIKELCFEHGSIHHDNTVSNRFIGDKFEYKDGILEKAVFDKNIKTRPTVGSKRTECVKCSWAEDNIININPDGSVMPCCFIDTRYYEYKYKFGPLANEHHLFKHSTITEYIEEDHNVFKHSLIDIIDNSKYLNKTLPRDIKEKPYSACIKNCSVIRGDLAEQKIN